jgi:hypothetical protein
MALTDLPFKPGLFSNDTDRVAGKLKYWKSADKVRFYNGLPQPIGGWRSFGLTGQIVGIPRTAFDWQQISSSAVYAGIGTHLKLMIWSGGDAYDVTPIRTSGNLANPFSTTDTSTVVNVHIHPMQTMLVITCIIQGLLLWVESLWMVSMPLLRLSMRTTTP